MDRKRTNHFSCFLIPQLPVALCVGLNTFYILFFKTEFFCGALASLKLAM